MAAFTKALVHSLLVPVVNEYRNGLRFFKFILFQVFFVSQICTASSKSDVAQGYINKAGVAWLRMCDLIFPFVILKL